MQWFWHASVTAKGCVGTSSVNTEQKANGKKRGDLTGLTTPNIPDRVLITLRLDVKISRFAFVLL